MQVMFVCDCLRFLFEVKLVQISDAYVQKFIKKYNIALIILTFFKESHCILYLNTHTLTEIDIS
jgi:hypothetical protein